MGMDYFKAAITEEMVKQIYRMLVKTHHPDRGGNVEMMKQINYQYARKMKQLNYVPDSLNEVRVGCKVFVNNTPCIVTQVDADCFKAKSLETEREAFFSKATGYAMLNYKFKANVKID